MICLSAPARRTIEQEARRSADGRETGGILLGHDASDDHPLRVTVAGEPGPGAKRSAFRFLRDLDHSRRLADEAYERDGSVWVGEWHTHPKGPSRPSRRDLHTYRQLLSEVELGFERFAAIIVTIDGDRYQSELHGWTFRIAPDARGQLLLAMTDISSEALLAKDEPE